MYSREEIIDQAVVEQGAKLTAIGMGTAFAILLLLTLVIMVMGSLAGRVSRGAAPQAAMTSDETSLEVRDRALAAVVAVSAVLENGDAANHQEGNAT